MSYFRFPLASLHCAQRNNHIKFRKSRACKGQGNRNHPHGYPRGESQGAGNKCCVKRKIKFHQRLQVEGLALPSIQQDPQPQSPGIFHIILTYTHFSFPTPSLLHTH